LVNRIMKRGLGLGEKFAREKFTNCWSELATKDETNFLEQVNGGAWCSMTPQNGWENFIGFQPKNENYLEFLVLIYPIGEPFVLARFLVPRNENEEAGFLIWNHYQGKTIFQEV